MKLYSRSIAVGCSHNCTYCYVRQNALEKGEIRCVEEWATERVLAEKANEVQRKSPGVTYKFPANHDITPALLQPSLGYIGNLLRAGNNVLVCTKPHLECVRAICDEYRGYKEQLEFDMTITSLDEHRSRLFEPGAPLPQERLAALHYASGQGFKCSVRIEPLLEAEVNTGMLIESVYPYISGNITVGKMVNAGRRLVMSEAQSTGARQLLDLIDSHECLKALYRRYQGVCRGSGEPIISFTIPTLEVVDPKQAAMNKEMLRLLS